MNYKVRLRRGSAKASMVMDHGRSGPLGALGGENGGVNRVLIERNVETYIPPHLSKDQNILIEEGDTIRVSTPGGGGYGNPFQRDPELVSRDVHRGYYSSEEAHERFGVILNQDCSPDVDSTHKLRES